ncbi:MAG: endolytic transglycosylase MltG [Chloroflexi bacterium]|nr:endolytic transglycosylase MltG [Chloroflexota bacterium]
MSIRGGRNPRDQARPMDPGAYEGADLPNWRASDGRGKPPPGRRPGRPPERRSLPGILKFGIFAVVLAAVVLVAGLTALRPLVQAAVVGWAWDNTSSFRLPFVADFVRADLGAALTNRETGAPDVVIFEVASGDSVAKVAGRLKAQGFVSSERAFIFTAIEANLAPALQAGQYLLRHDMTPAEVARALVEARVVTSTVDVTFREGIRLEQITAKLETVTSGVNPKDFYDLVEHPTAKLRADYPWLADIPPNASLEGFLYPATYKLVTSSNGPSTSRPQRTSCA